MSNPWKAAHLATEAVFNPDCARQLVDQEFEGHEQSEDTCGCCGAAAYYRATVGAVQCPQCRALLIVRIEQGTYTERWVA